MKTIGGVLLAIGGFMLISMAPSVFSNGSVPVPLLVLALILCGVGEFLRQSGGGASTPSAEMATVPYSAGGSAEREYDMGLSCALKGEMETGRTHFQQALDIDPNYDPARSSLPLLDDCIAGKLSREAVLHIFRGADYGNRNDLAKAVDCLSKAIAAAPGYALSYVQRGVFVSRQGDHFQAIKDFNQALELDPSSAQAHTMRGFSRAATGGVASALEDFNHAILLDPTSAFAFTNRGVLHMQAGRTNEACSDFKKAADFGQPNNYLIAKQQGLCE